MNQPKLIQLPPSYVMIRAAKQPVKTDRQNRSSFIKIDTQLSQSNYQDEKEKLTCLIQKSMLQPNKMEVYLSEFMKSRNLITLPNNNRSSVFRNRSRVNSQPILDDKLKRKTENHTPVRVQQYKGRRYSMMNSLQLSPNNSKYIQVSNQAASPSQKTIKSLHTLKSEQTDTSSKKKNVNISKLSTNGLIQYHKNLVLTAQKLINTSKRK